MNNIDDFDDVLPTPEELGEDFQQMQEKCFSDIDFFEQKANEMVKKYPKEKIMDFVIKNNDGETFGTIDEIDDLIFNLQSTLYILYDESGHNNPVEFINDILNKYFI